jgi:ecotin
MMKTGMATLLALLSVVTSGRAEDLLKAFPPAGEGMVRYVLQLPPQKDESAYKVELIAGRTVRTDARNRYFFGGTFEAETIEGWGFTRYKLAQLGPMAGTLIGVDPGEPKLERFITLGGNPYLIRYNSRLPVVVYVPEGVEVRYRIWSAGPETLDFKEG